MSDARRAMLDRISAALGPGAEIPGISRDYMSAGAVVVGAATVERFCERVADYRATVHRVTSPTLDALLCELIAGRGARTVAMPPGCDWRPQATTLRIDSPPLSMAELDRTDLVITGCALAIAETGTVVLDGTGTSGRRLLSLVSDHHICVVRAHDIVATVPDAIAALDPRRPLTFVSGPSATSDIEFERVEGVHGPRVLDVIVVG
jgi:L-lactate dehydrogenase complex protein LldG